MKKRIKKWLALITAVSVISSISVSVPVSAATMNDINGHWAESTIRKWVNLGYISGYPDNTFCPDKAISRAEFVVLVNKAFQTNNLASISFSDVPASYWAYNEIRKGVAAGYIRGNGNGTFSPGSMVTRQEAAVMIAGIKNLDLSSSSASFYNDSYAIADWSRGYVGAVSGAGIMKGFPNGDFKPQSGMTRSEAVMALDKALAYSKPSGGGNNQKPDNTESSTVSGDYTFSVSETVLKNKTIKGDLIIPEELSGKNITLENITVEGKVLVRGGNVITLEGSSLSRVVMDKSNAELKADKYSSVKTLSFESNGKISGYGFKNVNISDKDVDSITVNAEVESVLLDTEAKVRILADSYIDELEATKNADSSSISMSKGSKVDKMILRDKVKITGDGKIGTMTVYVSGIKSEIRPSSTVTKDGASKPSYSSSGSSSSGSSSKYDDLTLDDEDKKFDGDGDKYRDITIKADGVRLMDTVVTRNLTIDKKVGTGSVTIEDTDIHGNVYVYGGGENSVTFKNCNIDGDIISDISDRYTSKNKNNGQPVTIKFDKECKVDGNVRILDNTNLVSYGTGSKIKLPKVTVEKQLDKNFEIGINAGSLTIEKPCDIELKDGIYIDTAEIESGAGTTEINFYSGNPTVGTLTTHAKTELSGEGYVNQITAYAEIKIGSDVGYGSAQYPNDTENDVKVTGVAVSPQTAEVDSGKTVQLTAQVSPAGADNKKVVWSSSDTGIATVDSTGNVTGVKTGTATITAKTDDGGKTASCTVTVKEPAVSIKLSAENLTLEGHVAKKLTAVVEPESTPDKTVVFESSDDSIVSVGTFSVNQEVMVMAQYPGKAIITVRTKDGKAEAKCNIEVKYVAPTDFTIDSEMELKTDDKERKRIQISPVSPKNAMLLDDHMVYTSENENVAAVDKSGFVTAKGAGKTNITVNIDGIVRTCAVTVTQPVTGITINKTEAALGIGDTLDLTAQVQPADAANTNISWSSSDSGVATVDSNTGKVTAVKAGTATITAKTEEGGFEASCAVTVNDVQVTGISGVPGALAILSGKSSDITPVIEPAGATDKGWSAVSSNSDVASANIANGVATVKGIKGGTARITFTANGVGAGDVSVTAVCDVTVTSAPASITGVPSELELTAGKESTLNPAIEPAEAEKKFVFECSDTNIATVDKSGKIKAVSTGTAYVYVYAEADRSVFTGVTVKVKEPVKVSAITFGQSSYNFTYGNDMIINFKVSPENAADNGVQVSADSQYGSVIDSFSVENSGNGVISIKAKNNVTESFTVTVTAKDGSGVTGQCTVSITEFVELPII